MGTPNTITGTVKEPKTFVDRITNYLPEIMIPNGTGQEAVTVPLKDVFVWAQETALSMAKNLIGSPPAVVKMQGSPPQMISVKIQGEDADKMPPEYQKIWDEKGWLTWFIFGTELALGGSAVPFMLDPHMLEKDFVVTYSTMGGFGLGAAIGNLACRPIDSPGWFMACQGLTGLAGAGLAFGLSYGLIEEEPAWYVEPPKLPELPPLRGPDHRWPTDSYGP